MTDIGNQSIEVTQEQLRVSDIPSQGKETIWRLRCDKKTHIKKVYGYGYYAAYCTNSLFALFSVNAIVGFLAVNAMLSIASVNSIASIASMNCAFCIACSGTAFCVAGSSLF